jgi:uncharacterized protein (DUF4415 family)
MPKLKKGTIIPTPEEDAQINAGIAADPDTYELSDEEFKLLRPHGEWRSEGTKVSVSLLLDTDVLHELEALGPDWETRVNDLLRSALRS